MSEYEHLEDLPDQDEIGIQGRVRNAFFGVTPPATVPGEPSREQEAQALVDERRTLTAAAAELAQTLALSERTVSRVIQTASQTVYRTVNVPSGPSVRLLSKNFERSRVLIRPLVQVVIAISNMPIEPFDMGSPVSAALLEYNAAMPYLELRTTDEVWCRVVTGGIDSYVSMIEDFVS